jgi:uncharacterized protein YjbJ (UPF0337 family)
MSELEDKLKGNWNEIKGKLRQEYAILDENDLAFEVGQEEELIGKIQQKTGKAKEEIKAFIDSI